MQNADTSQKARAPISQLIEEVVEVSTTGSYDDRSETWSHRRYDSASKKKNNEQM